MAYNTHDIGDDITLYIDAYNPNTGVLVANNLYTLTIIEPTTTALAARTTVLTWDTRVVTVSSVSTTTTGLTNFTLNTTKRRYEYVFRALRSGKHTEDWKISGPGVVEVDYFMIRKSAVRADT